MLKKVVKGYKFEIRPNKNQLILIEKTFGCVRLVHNILLEKSKKGIYLSIPEIKAEHPYTFECDSQAFTSSWKDLRQAYKNYKNGTHKEPTWMRKFGKRPSYRTETTNNNVRIEGKKIKLPKLGYVKLIRHRNLPEDSKIKAATIIREAGKYYVALRIEYYVEEVTNSNDFLFAIGLDYSESKLYVNQYGNTPPHVEKYLKALDILDDEIAFQQKKLSRMVEKSNNWIKQKRKIQKLYKHKSNKRKDFLHKESRRIVNIYDYVVTEDLDLKSMGEKPEYNPEEPIDMKEASRAKKRRKSMFKASYSMFLTMLKYKLDEANKTFLQVNQYFPSTRRCSRCGNEKDMPLNVRTYVCEQCGHIMDRDVNSAHNIINEGLRLDFVHENNINQYKWINLQT